MAALVATRGTVRLRRSPSGGREEAPIPAHPHRPEILLALTKDGRVADPTVFEKLAQRLPSVTDCFVFCHGWLNDTAEARRGAARFFGLLEGGLQALQDRVVPLRVALHWPSKPFADPDLTRGGSSEGSLWPEFERRLARSTPGANGALRRVLRELIEAEVPLSPEEEAELDSLLGSLGDRHGGLLLSPFHSLSFWVMKRRAGEVGERFGREHFAPLWQALSHPPRLHLIGHSFGAKLLTAAVLGGVRPETLVLLQAAFSAFAFAPEVPGYGRPGFYHRVLAEGRVAGSIVALRSIHDTALRVLYPLVTGSGQVDRVAPRHSTKATVAKSAMGAVGIRGVSTPEVELTTAQRIGLPRWAVVNVDGSAVLKASAFLLGAHLDIFHPEVAALVGMAAGLLQGHPDGVRPRPVNPLDPIRGGLK